MLVEITAIKVIYDNILAFNITFAQPCINLVSTIPSYIWCRRYISYKAWQVPIRPHIKEIFVGHEIFSRR